MKQKESKWSLVIYIPCIIGSMTVAFAGAYHIQSIPNITIIGLLEWIFQIGICGIVIKFGVNGFLSSLEELKKVF